MAGRYAAFKHIAEGYIYPKEERPVRDFLRRRLLFVRHRTSQILSLQSMVSRNIGTGMLVRDIERLDEGATEILFSQLHLVLAAKRNIAVIHFLKERIRSIEKAVKSYIKLCKEMNYLAAPLRRDLRYALTSCEVSKTRPSINSESNVE